MDKGIFLTSLVTILAISIYVFMPQGWVIIYSNINGSIDSTSISKPTDFSKNELEDTFNAPRSEGRSHEGSDIFVSYGAEVYSVVDGTILYTGRDTYGGNVVKILGRDMSIYYYAHLDSYLDFESGENVKQNDIIGYVGKTGNALSTPPHLHFEIMNIKWYLPIMTQNINPYPELIRSSEINSSEDI